LLNSASTAPESTGLQPSYTERIRVNEERIRVLMRKKFGYLSTGNEEIDLLCIPHKLKLTQYRINGVGFLLKNCELVVTKSLGLLDAKGSYINPLAHKLVLYAISKVDPLKPLPKEMHITALEFAGAFNLPLKYCYEQLYNALDKLWVSEVTWTEKNKDGSWDYDCRWIQRRGKKIKGAGAISFVWAEEVHAGLSKIRNGFKSYQLQNIARLDTSHAIRLYEILIRYKDSGYRVISVDDIKEMLGITGKYPLINDFKRYVINPTVKHINAKTNLRVKWNVKEPVGRKITHLEFKFKLENQLKLNLEVKSVKKASTQKASLETDENTKNLVDKYGGKKEVI